MTDDEADLISHEVARWMHGTSVNKKHGARIVQSGGLIAAGAAVFEWGDRVAGALRLAAELNAGNRPAHPNPPGGNTNVAGPTPGPIVTSPDFTG